MTGLIFKLSYNKVGGAQVGGVCGSCFFIKPNIIATAHHVISKASFQPNAGFNYYQYWAAFGSDVIIELNPANFMSYPEIDTTFIETSKNYSSLLKPLNNDPLTIGDKCYNKGFKASCVPSAKGEWRKNKLFMSRINGANCLVTGIGFIKNLKTYTVKSKDVNIKDVSAVETSYPGAVGMSGGPLIQTATGNVIGLMSFGLPADATIKTTCLAIDIRHLVSKI